MSKEEIMIGADKDVNGEMEAKGTRQGGCWVTIDSTAHVCTCANKECER